MTKGEEFTAKIATGKLEKRGAVSERALFHLN